MSYSSAKMHQFDFDWGPAGGAYSFPLDFLAGFKGPTSKGKGGEGMGWDRTGWEGKGEEASKRRVPKVTPSKKF